MPRRAVFRCCISSQLTFDVDITVMGLSVKQDNSDGQLLRQTGPAGVYSNLHCLQAWIVVNQLEQIFRHFYNYLENACLACLLLLYMLIPLRNVARGLLRESLLRQ
jgi:hypothetical protein